MDENGPYTKPDNLVGPAWRALQTQWPNATTEALAGWLSRLKRHPMLQKFEIPFPVSAHTQAAGLIPRWGTLVGHRSVGNGSK